MAPATVMPGVEAIATDTTRVEAEEDGVEAEEVAVEDGVEAEAAIKTLAEARVSSLFVVI